MTRLEAELAMSRAVVVLQRGRAANSDAHGPSSAVGHKFLSDRKRGQEKQDRLHKPTKGGIT